MSNSSSISDSPHSSVPGSPRVEDFDEYNDPELIPMLMYPGDLSKLPSALRTHGGAYIVSPPLPPPPIAEASSSLFALSPDAKSALRHPGGVSVRGYNCALKLGREWWDYSPQQMDPAEDPDGLKPSTELIPPDAEFVEATERYFRAALKLLHECISVFRTPSEYGTDMIPGQVTEQGDSTLRYLRYSTSLFPEQTARTSDPSSERVLDKGKGRADPPSSSHPVMKPHTDHGILTLMTATSPSALYIYTPEGIPLPAPPLPNAVLIIAGDCLAHWTREALAPAQQPLADHSPDFSSSKLTDNVASPTTYAPPPYPPPGTRANASAWDSSRPPMLLPTPHEVVMPVRGDTDAQAEEDRISLAVFLRPAKDVVLYRKPCSKSDIVAPSGQSSGDTVPNAPSQKVSSETNRTLKDPEANTDVMTFGRWAAEKGLYPPRRCWLVGRGTT
ncbi:hypothetical protein HGRIS_007189 [Hohenbuehelia grisea]|uniref:Fe2OG dioxygenase domain-containing protein n=1 Tax=Hohenbuehelia grisea TaxID=104357 RepID=A0ABR3JBZ3_9AGAR